MQLNGHILVFPLHILIELFEQNLKLPLIRQVNYQRDKDLLDHSAKLVTSLGRTSRIFSYDGPSGASFDTS